MTKKAFITAVVLSSSLLCAQTYTTESEAIAQSKNEACAQALQDAKVLAMEEAGTLVFSQFSATTSEVNKKVSKSNQHQLITTALGVAKLQSKHEDVKVTPQYQFTCKVKASFSIDEDELAQSLKEMVQKQQEEQKLQGYFQAEGYSEENQSRYRAFTSATMIAQRNLLEMIQGSEITSLTTVAKGKIDKDNIGKLLSGTLQGAEVVKKKYDSKTRSAHVVLRVKKKKIADALDLGF